MTLEKSLPIKLFYDSVKINKKNKLRVLCLPMYDELSAQVS